MIEIYTKLFCPYCIRAKRLLRTKGVEFKEIDVTWKPTRRAGMRERAGGAHTVPQIFINDSHLGDCEALFAMDANGELDRLISAGERTSDA